MEKQYIIEHGLISQKSDSSDTCTYDTLATLLAKSDTSIHMLHIPEK